ncbi:ATPase involved in DNA repair [Leptolyngbya valderiana BDU 20041]|nr:heterocyst differentiation protein HetZ [Geitlerinema sp. CS-897]OAB62115.1 ATPase involved in DNA repair [Leptolyngbya valderiana BDU 20041]PPT10223.1 ATPase involved in DNA repair [Geitlerinema sp. FC II]
MVTGSQQEADRQDTETLVERVARDLHQSTRASQGNCQTVAARIVEEVERTCTQSQRIQASGEVAAWADKLARHRVQQCLNYYRLGSRGGRVELHSTLSAIIYRYITPPSVQSSYYGRLQLIEDFLQGFYVESLNALRREFDLEATYSPRTLLELSEYMAFTERYAKRRITLKRGRSQQLVILRAQTFAQQQPPEFAVDLDRAGDGKPNDTDTTWSDTPTSQVRDRMVDLTPDPTDDLLRSRVIDELIAYLEANNQSECADYFVLRLQDLPTQEIEAILGLTSRQRDYLQQRFKYHLIRFALSHRWELVHEWLDADLDRDLGMTSSQWKSFLNSCSSEEVELLQRKRRGESEDNIAQQLGRTPTQIRRRWFQLLKRAWEIRNERVSGGDERSDE